jgi:hypothetical protein
MDDAPIFENFYPAGQQRPAIFTKDQPGAKRAYAKRVTLTYPQRRQVEERLKEVLTVLGDPADQMCKYAPGFSDIRVSDEMPFTCTAACVETVRRAVFGKLYVKAPEPSAPSNEVAALRAEITNLRALVVDLQDETAQQHKEMAVLYEETGSQRSDIDALTVRLNRLASALGEPA